MRKLDLDLSDGGLGSDLVVVGDAHLLGEGGVGLPASGGAGSGLLHHLVDLLEGKTLGLGDEEVGVDEGAGAEGAPDEEDLGTEVALVSVDHVGGDDGDDAVPQPVGGGGEGDTAGTDGQGEDLADDDPGTGAPSGGEEEDVDADEGDHGGDSVGVVAVGDTNDGDDELADDHAEGTPEEERTTTDLLNGPEGKGGGAHVDNGGDHGEQEGVLDCAELLEEGGTEVEDEVDTSPLLHHLEGGTEDSAADVGVGVEDVAAEAVEPAVKVSGVRDDGHLVLVVGLDLVQLELNVLRVGRLATDAGESLASSLLVVLADEETGGLGQEEETSSENQSPEHLQSNGNTVGAGVSAVLGSVVNARGQHETDGDAELVAGDDGTTDLAGSNLGHVQNDDGGNETDTESSNQTTSNEKTEAGGSSLEDNTNDENEAASNDGGTTTEPVSQVTGDQSTEESTSRQNRDDEGLLPRGDDKSIGIGNSQGGVLEGAL